MADDTLRMRAVVEDGYTAPLAELRKQLRSVSGSTTGRAVEKDWKAVGKSVSEVASSLRLGVAGGLRAVGLTSLAAGVAVGSVGVALGAAALGVRKLAGETRSLRIFSDQIGMSVQQLRELKVLGEHFGMSWDTAQGSLVTFASNLDLLRRHWGEAYNQLRGMNLAGLAESLASAPDMKTALDRALAGIRAIQNPVRRREVAQLLLGTSEWAVVATEASAKLRQQIAETLKALPAGSTEAADKFANDMLRIGMQLENLRTQFLAPLLPPFERLLKLMAGAGEFGSGAVGKTGAFLGHMLTAIEDGVEALTGNAGSSPAPKDADRALAEKFRDDERALETMRERVAKQEELARAMEKLRKTLEDARRDGALLQNQSYNGIGIGAMPSVIPASLRTGGFPQLGSFTTDGFPRDNSALPRFGNREYANLGDPAAGAGSVGERGNRPLAIQAPLMGLPKSLPQANDGKGLSIAGSGMNDAESFDRTFKGTALQGKWPQVEVAAKENNVPANLMAAIMAHETGRGANLKGNNVAGLMDPAANMMRKQQFASIEQGIAAAGKTIGKNWDRAHGDLAKMADNYAPPGAANDPAGLNGGWLRGVRGFMGLGGAQGAGIAAPAGTPIQRGMVEISSPGGRKFKVDPRFAENFKGFLADYESAGGVIGRNSGTLGERPSNASGHPIGTAIDINQVDRNVRKGGISLPPDTEDALARKWGFVNGANWRNPDAGHFGIESERAALAALDRINADRAKVASGPPASAPAPPSNTVDLLAQARRADAAVMTHRVEGNASLKIDLNGLPEGSRVRSSFDGMFREVNLRRSRPMASAYDKDSR